MLGLARHVKGLRRLRLHPPGQLHRGQPRLELRIMLPRFEMTLVEGRREIELPPLSIAVEHGMPHILDEVLDAGLLCVDIGALEGPRQKGAPPVFGVLDRIAAGAHRHEAGEILVLGAQAIGHPRAGRRPDQPRIAAVHQHQRRLVVGNVGMHRPHDEQPVGVAGHVGKEVAHLEAALAVPREGKGRRQGGPGPPLGG